MDCTLELSELEPSPGGAFSSFSFFLCPSVQMFRQCLVYPCLGMQVGGPLHPERLLLSIRLLCCYLFQKPLERLLYPDNHLLTIRLLCVDLFQKFCADLYYTSLFQF